MYQVVRPYNEHAVHFNVDNNRTIRTCGHRTKMTRQRTFNTVSCPSVKTKQNKTVNHQRSPVSYVALQTLYLARARIMATEYSRHRRKTDTGAECEDGQVVFLHLSRTMIKGVPYGGREKPPNDNDIDRSSILSAIVWHVMSIQSFQKLIGVIKEDSV
ncbi:hypothetical protein JOM56_011118 [Amanita muscaria]